jgi:hypothetical protein
MLLFLDFFPGSTHLNSPLSTFFFKERKSGINAVLNDFWDLIPGDGIGRLESGFILLGFGV